MQTTEENEVCTTEKPSCWQEPEEEVYWVCEIKWKPNLDFMKVPTGIYRTEAEAALHGAQNPNALRVVGTVHTTLHEAIARAINDDRPSVELRAYEHGKWVTLREYPL